MSSKSKLPPGLPAEVARPLLAVAERIRPLAPWKRMLDSHLIGLRDDASGELQIASVLGTLGTMFAIIIYRHEGGLRWIHQMATAGEAEIDPDISVVGLDYLKVEWIRKGELTKPDLETLAAANFKPAGKGPIWPQFQSCDQGWHPWYPKLEEARLLTEHLKKALRLFRLLEQVPDLYSGHPPGEVPVIPAGDEFTLTEAAIEWFPLLLRPEPKPEAVVFSTEEQARLTKLPIRKDFVFEFAAPLMPEMSFWDEKAGRPCLARACLLIDRQSHYVFGTELASGPAPLHVAIKPVLVKGLLEAKVRPGEIHVHSEAHADVLRGACEEIGVSLQVVDRLAAAEDALGFLAERFRPRGR